MILTSEVKKEDLGLRVAHTAFIILFIYNLYLYFWYSFMACDMSFINSEVWPDIERVLIKGPVLGIFWIWVGK